MAELGRGAVQILVSFEPVDDDNEDQPQIAGAVRFLGARTDAAVDPDQPAAFPAPATGEALPFSGWLQLLGHLERMSGSPELGAAVETAGG